MSPNFLVRDWPPAFKEWSTRSVCDAFFASPQFPRLLHPDSIKDTIARGVENVDGSYAPFHWKSSLSSGDVEISDDVFLIQREVAEAFESGRLGPAPSVVAARTITGTSGTTVATPVSDGKSSLLTSIARLVWSGDIPHQKWMNFYTKVLSRFSAVAGLKLTLRFEVAPAEGISSQKVEETKVALRELGLKDSLDSN